MRLGRKGEYAVRAIFYMCLKPFGSVISKREISANMDIPEKFLAKIAEDLKRAGIIEIVQGSKGGFRLIRKPEEISLLMVVEAISGRIFLNDCILRPEGCNRSDFCTVNKVWRKAVEQLRDVLGNARFSDLVKSELCDQMDPYAKRVTWEARDG